MSWVSPKLKERLRAGEKVTLTNLRVPISVLPEKSWPEVADGLTRFELTIADGKILSLEGGSEEISTFDMKETMAWPCPVDCHTHIDKGQVWGRSPNSDGAFSSALEIAHFDALNFSSPEEIYLRAEFSIRSAYAHGTAAIRTHVDVNPELFDPTFERLCSLAVEWEGKVDVQLCPFTGPDVSEGELFHLALKAKAHHAGVLSFFLYTTPNLPSFLDQVIDLAERQGLALDFHADENLDPNSHCLRAVSEAVLRNKFQGPVLVGHCCSLATQSAREADKTLDLAAEAGISIVSLPLCNSYLMDRHSEQTPKLRGFPPLAEMKKLGIPIALASDNCRDAFYAYGDLDTVELFRDAVKLMQLDHPVGNWPSAVLNGAADAMGLEQKGRFYPGAAADFLLFPARNWSEFISRPQNQRLVIRKGSLLEEEPPSYQELDQLEGMRF